jgi:hypothetical protein
VRGEDGDWSGAATTTSMFGADGSKGGGGDRCKSSVVTAAGVIGPRWLPLVVAGRGRASLAVAGWSWPWPAVAGWSWPAAAVAGRSWLWPALGLAVVSWLVAVG